MSNIVKFLEDRLREDELAASEAEKKHTFWDSVFHPVRALREVAAKRALMALHGLETLSHQPAPYELPEGFAGEFVGYCQLCSDLDYPEGLATYYEPWPCPSTRILASVYDQHADYNPAWSVDA